MSPRALSGLDAALLQAESPRAPLHTVAVAILDGSSLDGEEGGQALLDAVERAARRIDRLRGRIAEHPLALAPPAWEDDGPPDLAHHVVRLGVPAPGGPRELARVVDELLARPLPRGCPLWEIALVEGLSSGALAVVIKLHCVPADGTTAWDVAFALAESAATGAPAGTEPGVARGRADRTHQVAGDPDDARAWLGALARTPARLAGAALHTARVAARGLSDPRGGRSPRPTAVAGSCLNRRAVARTRSAHATLRSASVEDVAEVFGVEPIDVLLSVVAGALRVELEAVGERHKRPLVAAVVPTGPAKSVGGLELPPIRMQRIPTHIALPAARLRIAMRDRENGPELLPPAWRAVVSEWTDAAAPFLFGLAARAGRELELGYRLAPVANLVVSHSLESVGPGEIAGARVEHVYPHGPVIETVNLHVAIQRVGAAFDVGITLAEETLTDAWRFAASLSDALYDLSQAALALKER